MEQPYTFLNKDSLPIVRRCENCKHWRRFTAAQEQQNNLESMATAERKKPQYKESGKGAGICKKNPLMFAYSREHSSFFITRYFNACNGHLFNNEEELEKSAVKIDMADAIAIKNNFNQNNPL